MMWKIYKYHCDMEGRPYGDITTSMCYTTELMESYKNRKFVEKIEQITGSDVKTIWTREYQKVNG